MIDEWDDVFGPRAPQHHPPPGALPTTRSARSMQRAGHTHRAPTEKRYPWYVSYLAGLALIALLTPLHHLWSAQVLLLLLLLILPGVILLRALRIPGNAISSFPVYVPCASIVVLIGTGLAVDLAGLFVGAASPLRPGPLLVGLEFACLMLLASSADAPSDVQIPWRSLSRPARLVWPLALPLLAAAGALWLNNGRGNSLAIIATIAIVLTLIWAILRAPRLDKTLLAVILYAAGLSMEWAFSLRGQLADGFDISTEFYDMNRVVVTGVWHPAHANDIYGAMLSVTILPATLHAISGVPGLLLLNVVYPAIYALFPVAVYSLGRRILARRWAFLAPVFIMGEYYFAEMKGFARVEIALVFFAALVAAVLDNRMPKRWQWVLVTLLGLAVAVSHYSTDYLAITILGLILPLQWAASLIRDIPRISSAVAVAFGATLVGAIIWYGPVTHSTANVGQFMHEVSAQGFDLLPNHSGSGNLLDRYLQGNTTQQISAAQYAELVHSYYKANRPFVKPLPDAGLPRYTLRNLNPKEPPVRWQAGFTVLSEADLFAQQIANLLSAIGALWMVLYRKATIITRQTGMLALAMLIVLAVTRLSGTINATYGQERALLQGFVILSISLGWLLQLMSGANKKRKRRTQIVFTVTALSLTVIFFNTTYLINALIGGGAGIDLANNGAAYEFYYRTAAELASAEWLGKAVKPGQLVYADEYAQLPIDALTDIREGLLLDVTPLTINQHAWVYASRTNVIDGQAFAHFNSYVVNYVFPYRFLKANFDLVYTDGSSEVFHK